MTKLKQKDADLYNFLKSKANDKKQVFLFDKQISEALEMPTSTLTVCLRNLEENGFIKRKTSSPMKTTKGYKKVRVIIILK